RRAKTPGVAGQPDARHDAVSHGIDREDVTPARHPNTIASDDGKTGCSVLTDARTHAAASRVDANHAPTRLPGHPERVEPRREPLGRKPRELDRTLGSDSEVAPPHFPRMHGGERARENHEHNHDGYAGTSRCRSDEPDGTDHHTGDESGEVTDVRPGRE